VKNLLPNWARPCLDLAGQKYREATWSKRSLPAFLIIGAQKAGTTNLYAHLSEHPQLVHTAWKEVHFFNGGLDPAVDVFEKGERWYRSHFPLTEELGERGKTFEATPLYLFNPLCPQRIAGLLPNVKLIALLRNPTERAISQYFHEKRLGKEPLEIEEALEAEENRLKPLWEAKDYKHESFIHHSYKSRGLYQEQLERYTALFPKEQLLIMSSEKLFSDPVPCMRRIFEFIGVDPDFQVSNQKAKGTGENKKDVSPDVYTYLNEFFKTPNQELYEFVGEDYGW